ncbi:MAG: hypothetical protein ACRERR_11670 [Moraxellaceae bacterium]
MKYILRSRLLVNTHEETIDISLFNTIKHSRKVLTSAFQIEEIFDNLISNYLEVETRCLELTARRLVRQAVGYREGNEALSAINLVFVNYLSTARAYVDKIGSAASRCFPEAERPATKERVKALLAEQCDAAFGYRFMEALRNHVQHNGSALHTLSQGSRRMKVDQSEMLNESFLEPLCNKGILVERGGFKAAVLAECPDQVNLLEAARVHVRALSHIHRIVRDLTSEVITEAVAQIKAGQQLLEGKVTGSLDSTEAASVQQDGDGGETVPLLLNWEEVRSWLAQRNSGISDGIRTYPSGRVAS